jgi:hypothetical protein
MIGVKVPLKHSCCEHHIVFGSQLKEQTVPLAMTPFFPKAQAPGGSVVLAEAAEKLAGNATAAASNTTFTTDITRMFIPHPLRGIIIYRHQAGASHRRARV